MRWGLLGMLALSGCAENSRESSEVYVFAAASLTDALEEITAAFTLSNPQFHPVINVAGTSLLARQIEQGAPADVFLSANQAWMSHLAAHGRIQDPAQTLTGNRLVVVGDPDAKLLPNPEFMLHFKRIALADPSHVPAGIYAKAALKCEGLWEAVEPNTIPMHDVRTALLAVVTRAAEVAIVYASDLHAAAGVREVLDWPADCTPDIRYYGARLRDAPNPAGAAAFLSFVTDSARASVWKARGFTEPDR